MWGQKRKDSKLVLMFLSHQIKIRLGELLLEYHILERLFDFFRHFFTSAKLYENSLPYGRNNFVDTKYDFLSPFKSTLDELFAPRVLLDWPWKYCWTLNWLLSFTVWSAWKKTVLKYILGSKIDNQWFWNNYSDVVPEFLTVVLNWNKVSLH